MKKALINPIDLIDGFPSVVEVSNTEFVVTSQYYWVDCPDDTLVGMYYNDGQFVLPNLPPPPPPIPPTLEQNKASALKMLQTTDWVEIPSVSDQTSTPYLVNLNDFISFRNSIRAIAVNPIEGFISWPKKPKEQWSN